MRETAPIRSVGVMLVGGWEAKTAILANELRKDREDNEYGQRTVFGCTAGACASGSNGARDNFHLLWSWLAACPRGLARQSAADGASAGNPALSATAHQPTRSETHERAVEFRAEPGAGGLHGPVSLARFRLRSLPHSGQGHPEPGAATAAIALDVKTYARSRLRRDPAHRSERRQSQGQCRRTGPAARSEELLHRQRPQELALRHPDLWQGQVSPNLPRRGSGLLRQSAPVGVRLCRRPRSEE